MLDDVVGWLRCPHCGSAMATAGRTLRCQAGHSFDIARQGYVSMLQPGARGSGGDTAAMVRARQEFLGAGWYAPVAAALADAAWRAWRSQRELPGCVADVGAGTGYYLAAVLDRLPGAAGLAIDLSRNALRQAARAHPRIGAVGCDAWRPLPVRDAAAAVVLNVFAPRDGAELRRILRPDGTLLMIMPAGGHLAELTAPLGLLSVDDRKRERFDDKLGPHFELVSEREHRGVMTLSHRDVAAVAAMGPSAWHAGQQEMAARIASLPDPVAVTRAVTLMVLRPLR